MAIYRIYPEKDTFISTEVPESNQGLDEILEIGNYVDISGIPRVNRTLIQFNTEELQNVVENIIPQGVGYSSSLKLYIAEASEIPTYFNIECFPLAQGWENGVGKFGDTPTDTSGVSWRYVNASQTVWNLPTSGSYTTSSYELSIPGGGVWFTGSVSGTLESVNTLKLYGPLDVNLQVTPAVQEFTNDSLENNGFIIKLPNSLEFSDDRSIRLRFFGRDTNTIYSPYLEFKWDDTVSTGSLQTATGDNIYISTYSNKGTYSTEDKIRFRLSVRPKYPVRTFTTSSIYLQNYKVPPDTTWGLVDEFTGEYVVEFDPTSTKISTDQVSSFVDIYTNYLYPNRYYRLMFKIKTDNTEVVLKDSSPFRVENV